MLYQALSIPIGSDEIGHLLIKVLGEPDFSFQDLLVNCHGIVVVEGVNASNHFEGQNTEGPPVYWLAVALVEQHFRRQVLGRAAECVRAGLTVLGEAEVSQLEVALFVY